jgi:hypothetical protein
VRGDLAKKLIRQRGGAGAGAAMGQDGGRRAGEKDQQADAQDQSGAIAQLHISMARILV